MAHVRPDLDLGFSDHLSLVMSGSNQMSKLDWRKQILSTWAILIILTILAPTIRHSSVSFLHGKNSVLLIAGIKMLLIAAVFMELRQAHRFWLGAVATVFCALILLSIFVAP